MDTDREYGAEPGRCPEDEISVVAEPTFKPEELLKFTEQELEVIADAKWRIAFTLRIPTDKIQIVLPNRKD